MIAQHLTKPETISNQLNDFFTNFLDKETIAAADMQKRSGTEAQDILLNELKLRLNNISIGTNAIALKTDVSINSDTYFNYNKRQQNDVLALTTMLAERVASYLDKGANPDPEFNKGLFIIDDTTYMRPYSRKTELASYQFDHTNGKTYLGYRAGELGFYKSGNYLPVNCVPVSTSNSEKIVSPERESNCEPGLEKRKLTQTKMTDVVLYQIDLAMEAGFEASHTLFDTWYSSPRMFYELQKRELYGIGMIKDSSKVTFYYNGKKIGTREIFEQNRFNPQQLLTDGFFFSVIVEADYKGERFPLKLFFYESDTQTREFICIGTTDLSLSQETVKLLYNVRWSTENYFADTKDVRSIQSTKQCQGQSIDAIYFDLALTEILYLFLALLLAEQGEPCSIRIMFQKASSGIQKVEFYKTLMKTLKFLIRKLSSEFGIEREKLITLFSIWLTEYNSFLILFESANPFIVINS